MAAQDRTANRVAICSAIFAGFAYVGYAVVRQVFGRRVEADSEHEASNPLTATAGLTGFFRDDRDSLGLEYEPADRGRLFLRRLSGSRPGGRCDGGSLLEGSLLLRPLSVRERIRELNLGAFTDTLLVLNGLKPGLSGRRSLPSSAMHSPARILSPADLQLEWLQADKDAEEDRDTNDNYSAPGTPRLSRHASRRSLARRSLAGSVASLSQAEQEEADSRAEALCQEREVELTRRLEGFQSSRPRELTPYEGRSLVALLHCNDRAKIAATLVTISNCAAFTRNQDLLREAGILVRLPALLAGPDRGVQLAAAMAAANLALNTGNMKEMEQVVLVLVLLAEDPDREPELLQQLLLALTNAAVLSDWHHHLQPLLPRLLALGLSPRARDRGPALQALKLLVNLACCPDTAPSLLAAPCPPGLPAILRPTEPEERLLRAVTLLANLAMAAERRGAAGGVAEPGSLQSRVFLEERGELSAAVDRLMLHHDNYDVRLMARKLHTVLESTKSAAIY